MGSFLHKSQAVGVGQRGVTDLTCNPFVVSLCLFSPFCCLFAFLFILMHQSVLLLFVTKYVKYLLFAWTVYPSKKRPSNK